jgi:single-stranded-DNA-specific exonuclease
VDTPGPGIRILTPEGWRQEEELARELNRANGERQRLERLILQQIDGMIQAMGGVEEQRSLVVAGEGWHPGVLGIVASRLAEQHLRPALVVNVKDGLAIGSGRSLQGFDLHNALHRLHHLLERWGGHAHAAGFTLKSENLPTLRKEFEKMARDLIPEERLISALEVDAEVRLDDVGEETVKQIHALAPFGEGNPEPVLCAGPVHVLTSRVVGEQHLKMRVTQGGREFDAIGFGMGNHHPVAGKRVHLAFTPERNYWQGLESIQLRVADLILENPGG